MYFPNDIWINIDLYLECKINSRPNLHFVNKELNKLIRCSIINYKCLLVCNKHANLELVNAIEILNRNKGKKPSSIYFKSNEIRRLVQPYLSDFGDICRLSCCGKGVMYT